MKRNLLFLTGLALMVSCSSPKYTYNFDYYKAGKKTFPAEGVGNDKQQTIPPQLLLASTERKIIIEKPIHTVISHPIAGPNTDIRLKSFDQKVFKKELKRASQIKKESARASSQSMDHDLKLAAIFGAVGIVALILHGSVFYVIGGIALIIGVVFFVKWLIRQ